MTPRVVCYQGSLEHRSPPLREGGGLSSLRTFKDCFDGPQCWCGIIVSPDGEECNNYGEICKDNCRYIIDALNKKAGAEHNVNYRYPVPWAVEELERGRCISTEAGVGTDDLETAISTAGGVFGDYDRLFVEAVNSFYRR